MDEKIIQDILTDVFSSLEPLDAQCAAVLQFLKAKGFATDKELAPFLEQARNASNVRWLAARLRIASLLSSAMKPVETKPADMKRAEQPPESHSTTNKPSEPAESERGEEEPKQKAQKNETVPSPQSAQARANNSTPENAGREPAETAGNKKDTPHKSQQPAQEVPTNEAKKEAQHEVKEKAA